MSDYPFPVQMPFDIKVTAEDIACGEAGSDKLCPVALSVRRLLGDGYTVSVENDYIYISDPFCGGGPVSWQLAMPIYLSNWVMAYDEGSDVSSIVANMVPGSIIGTLGPDD